VLGYFLSEGKNTEIFGWIEKDTLFDFKLLILFGDLFAALLKESKTAQLL